MKEMLEILKGKKQIVAVIAMWLLSTLKAENVDPGYITGVAVTGIVAQMILDFARIILDFKRKVTHETKTDIDDLHGGSVGSGMQPGSDAAGVRESVSTGNAERQ